jgi:hypothetical protein
MQINAEEVAISFNVIANGFRPAANEITPLPDDGSQALMA